MLFLQEVRKGFQLLYNSALHCKALILYFSKLYSAKIKPIAESHNVAYWVFLTYVHPYKKNHTYLQPGITDIIHCYYNCWASVNLSFLECTLIKLSHRTEVQGVSGCVIVSLVQVLDLFIHILVF